MVQTWQNRMAGDAIRIARTINNRTQSVFAEDLSRLLGYPITLSSVSAWERGVRAVPAAVLLAAAMLANVGADQLFTGPGTPAEMLEWVEATRPDRDLLERLGRLEARVNE